MRLALSALGVGLAALAAGSTPVRADRSLTIEHVVERGETLWSIAAQSDVYADPFLWPVIYKFNRDQIQDPARIYPSQLLQIPIHVDSEARAAARAEAGAPVANGGPRGGSNGAPAEIASP